jgi:hypothetical protein
MKGTNLMGYLNDKGTPAPTVVNSIGFGYYPPNDNMISVGPLEIIWVQNGVLMQRTLQTAWNIDPCDGTGKMSVLKATDMNHFKITWAHAANLIRFWVMRPDQGRYYPVHYIKVDKRTENVFPRNMVAPGVFADGTYNFMTTTIFWRLTTGGWALSSSRALKQAGVPRGMTDKNIWTTFNSGALSVTGAFGTRMHLLTIFNNENIPYLGPQTNNLSNWFISRIDAGYSGAGANNPPIQISVMRNNYLMENPPGTPITFTLVYPGTYGHPITANYSITNTEVAGLGNSGITVTQFPIFKGITFSYMGENLGPDGRLHMGPNCSYSLFGSSASGANLGAVIFVQVTWVSY